MSRRLRIAALAALCAVTASLVVGPVASGASRPAVTKKLLWLLEFNGKKGIKPSALGFKYDIGYSNGWGNSEVQYYTQWAQNASTDGKGNLVLTAQRIPFEHNLNVTQCGLGCEYVSARINTKGKLAFQYGRIEARIQTPVGAGTWPAFWMLGNNMDSTPWPECGEIDIMEGKGAASNTVWGTLHGPGYSGGGGIGNTYLAQYPLSDRYHVYAIEWHKNSIKWFFDGKLYHEMSPATVNGNKWVFNKPFFLIVNLAMGGLFGGETDPNVKSAKLNVDYIRYYKIGADGALKRY